MNLTGWGDILEHPSADRLLSAPPPPPRTLSLLCASAPPGLSCIDDPLHLMRRREIHNSSESELLYGTLGGCMGPAIATSPQLS